MAIFKSRLLLIFVFILALSLNQATQVRATKVLLLNQPDELNDYLCGSVSSLVTNGTTLELNSDVIHVIMPGQSCLWQNKGNIIVRGSGDRQATVSCNGSEYTQTGFGFIEMALTIRNVRFENCGGVVNQNTTALFAPNNTSPRTAINSNQHAVMFFSRCWNVTIEKVTMSNYRGYAIYAINLVGSNLFREVTVMDSYAFINENRSSSENDLTYSGSGMFLYFSDDAPILQENTAITIEKSTFFENFNIYPDFLLNSLLESRLQNQPGDFPLHGSGGLTIHFEQQKRTVFVNVSDTNFTNNGGSTGGGSLVVSRNTVDKSKVLFSRCLFANNFNRPSIYFPGVGLQLFYVFSYNKLPNITKTTTNVFGSSAIIENSEFRENTGEVGAAVAMYIEAQNVSSIKIDLKSVHFVDNEATIDGDCIFVESENAGTYSELRPSLKLESITVFHSGRKNDLDSTAALSFNNIFVTIKGTSQNPSIISNGKNGGLKLFNTYTFLTGEVHFVNNSANLGGAIAMEANSYLLFQEPANILFSNNEAIKGGAIYSDIVRGAQCVMQFIAQNDRNAVLDSTQLDELNFTITFIDNKADRDGDAIFAQPIFNCSWFSESVIQVPRDQVTNVYSSLYHFKVKGTSVNYGEQIRTHPYRPCFCQLNDTSSVPKCGTFEPVSVPPGRSFNIPIVPVDILWNPLESVINAQLIEESENDGIRFENNRTHFVKDLNGTVCFPQKFELRNRENTKVTIKLSVQSVVNEFIKTTITLDHCPLGFKLNETSGICDCVPLYAKNNIKCDIDKALFVKPETYWIGNTTYEKDVAACVVKCPAGYCQRNTSVTLNFDNQCKGNRTGDICGRCQSGMSMQFGSTDCRVCSKFWLFTIALYAIAGVLLVTALFSLKLTISDGLLSTVLFYAQLFSINIGLLVSTNETRFTTVFISLLNLELGFPLCFFDNMTQAVKHGMQFVFPIYIWLIVAVITIFSRYSTKIATFVGSECSKVFVTLIYFSYTKLQRTATDVFTPAYIGTDTNNNYTVWFFDGRVEYFSGPHLALGLISLAFLLLVLIPYTLFTLLSQWLIRNSWISRHFKPLIDATLAPFKDRWRFWFGLRLLVITALILISIVVTPIESNAVTYSHLVIVTLLLMFQAHIKPYKSKLLHYLDLFFLTNYVMFLISCLFIYDVLQPSKADQDKYITAVEVSIIGSAFVVFVLTIACHVVIRARRYYNEKRSGQLKPNLGEDQNVEMDDVSPLNSVHYSNEEYRPHNVTMSVVDMRNREDDDGARLRESLLVDSDY